MKVISVLLLCLTNSLRFYNAEVSDYYYWRDYSFTISSDAIPGGTSRDGYITYIGQFPGKRLDIQQTADVIIATVTNYSISAYGVYGSEVLSSSSNIKVLCTNYMGNLLWRNTTDNNCDLIRGGNNITNIFYIGRANYRGRNLTGGFTKDFILIAPWERRVITFKSFEMLMYCNN